jgi:propionyl-CoA carboxylase beta chain
VPIVNVVLRRGYGFGHGGMGGGESVRNVLTVFWPTAGVAAMGIEGAVDVVHGREIEAADDPGARRRELIGALRGPHRRHPVRRGRGDIRGRRTGRDLRLDPAGATAVRRTERGVPAAEEARHRPR